MARRSAAVACVGEPSLEGGAKARREDEGNISVRAGRVGVESGESLGEGRVFDPTVVPEGRGDAIPNPDFGDRTERRKPNHDSYISKKAVWLKTSFSIWIQKCIVSMTHILYFVDKMGRQNLSLNNVFVRAC
jgi:hypothetical protein